MKNIGNIDKIIRLVLAVVIIGLFLGNMITGTAAIILIVLAGILVITSLVSVCPLYLPFGISTLKKKK